LCNAARHNVITIYASNSKKHGKLEHIPCLPNRYIITFKFLQTRAFSITLNSFVRHYQNQAGVQYVIFMLLWSKSKCSSAWYLCVSVRIVLTSQGLGRNEVSQKNIFVPETRRILHTDPIQKKKTPSCKRSISITLALVDLRPWEISLQTMVIGLIHHGDSR